MFKKLAKILTTNITNLDVFGNKEIARLEKRCKDNLAKHFEIEDKMREANDERYENLKKDYQKVVDNLKDNLETEALEALRDDLETEALEALKVERERSSKNFEGQQLIIKSLDFRIVDLDKAILELEKSNSKLEKSNSKKDSFIAEQADTIRRRVTEKIYLEDQLFKKNEVIKEKIEKIKDCEEIIATKEEANTKTLSSIFTLFENLEFTISEMRKDLILLNF